MYPRCMLLRVSGQLRTSQPHFGCFRARGCNQAPFFHVFLLIKRGRRCMLDIAHHPQRFANGAATSSTSCPKAALLVTSHACCLRHRRAYQTMTRLHPRLPAAWEKSWVVPLRANVQTLKPLQGGLQPRRTGPKKPPKAGFGSFMISWSLQAGSNGTSKTEQG